MSIPHIPPKSHKDCFVLQPCGLGQYYHDVVFLNRGTYRDPGISGASTPKNEGLGLRVYKRIGDHYNSGYLWRKVPMEPQQYWVGP